MSDAGDQGRCRNWFAVHAAGGRVKVERTCWWAAAEHSRPAGISRELQNTFASFYL